ncbi:MAG: MFS transporter [Spirochaetales bacterium]|nr:MFS transporter [Spirochaetales bacterium]
MNNNYRWLILTLATLTHTFCVGLPNMCMPVMFDEIAGSLDLSLVQLGTIWGLGYVPGLISGIIAGLFSDRIGTKRSLIILCIVAGVAGALRGLSNGFATLSLTTFVAGFMFTAIPTNIHKVCGVWFTGKRLALANGFASIGMALGFMIASLVSASVMSPALGGWSNVLFFYGGISVLFGIVWSVTKTNPQERRDLEAKPQGLAMLKPLARIVKIRNAWILGFALLGVSGCVQGLLGYLSLYLRGEAWPAARADSTLATFHAVSMSAVLVITFVSDRIGQRKSILITAAAMTATGVGLLSFAHGPAIWAAVILAGIVRDGFMAVYMTSLIETEGIGPAYAGSAVGFAVMFTALASLLAPPIGNSFAVLSPRAPFAFWAILGLFGLGCLFFLKEPRKTAAEPTS